MNEFADLGISGLEQASMVGRGGFAVVYRAFQPAFRRTVAVKILTVAELDEAGRHRFERECHAMGLLSEHPGIVTVYEAGFTRENRPYLVMAFVSGGTLADQINDRGAGTWRDTLRVGVRLSGALETANRAQVIHRDVKPANVLMSRYGAQLTDFGIARVAGGPETRSGVVTASVAHAAPEILDGARPSVASDVYSLGSTLYTLLAGKPAFVRDTDESLLPLMLRIHTDPIPDLTTKGVPKPVSAVLEKAMAKDPADRYRSALHLGRALQEVQDEFGFPISELVVDPAEPDVEAPAEEAPTAPTPLVTPPGARPPQETPDEEQAPEGGVPEESATEEKRPDVAASAAATTPIDERPEEAPPADEDAPHHIEGRAEAPPAPPDEEATAVVDTEPEGPQRSPASAPSAPPPDTPSPPPGPSQPPEGRRRAAIVAAALGLVAIVTFGVIALGGDDDGDEGQTAATSPIAAETTDAATETTQPAASTEPSVTETTTPAAQPIDFGPIPLDVTIDEVTIEDGSYQVHYSTNYEPEINNDDPETNHIHFFFDTVPLDQAGNPGSGPWILYDLPSPFTGYTPADRPPEATQLCATAATFDHGVVDPNQFDCHPLPDVLFVTIDQITVENGAYAVYYSTNFNPEINNDDPETNHIHFFFDTVPVDQAGNPGSGPWILYDLPSPFTGYTPADRPPEATQLCATAATFDHGVVDPNLYHCELLPQVFTGEGNDLVDFDEGAEGLISPLSFDPSGSAVTRILGPEAGAVLVDYEHQGTGRFALIGLDASGADISPISDTSHQGQVSGTTLVMTSDVTSIRVEADGPWQVQVRPSSQVTVAENQFSGTGNNSVVLLRSPTQPPRAAEVSLVDGFLDLLALAPSGSFPLLTWTEAQTGIVDLPHTSEILLVASADGVWNLEFR